MSKIYAIDDFNTQNWVLNVNDLKSGFTTLFIGFTDKAPIVSFKNLSFGFELKEDGNIRQYGQFPKPGVKYVQTDQEYLVSVQLDTVTTHTYELFLWAENDATRIEKTFKITIPKPDKPFESWLWNQEQLIWQAPIERPDDNKQYTWNEEEQNWQLVEGDINGTI